MNAKQSKHSVLKTEVRNLSLHRKSMQGLIILREESFSHSPTAMNDIFMSPGCLLQWIPRPITGLNQPISIPAWRAAANCWNPSLEDEWRATPFMLYSFVMDPVGLFQ